jgi:hypothetical protein
MLTRSLAAADVAAFEPADCDDRDRRRAVQSHPMDVAIRQTQRPD